MQVALIQPCIQSRPTKIELQWAIPTLLPKRSTVKIPQPLWATCSRTRPLSLAKNAPTVSQESPAMQLGYDASHPTGMHLQAQCSTLILISIHRLC